LPSRRMWRCPWAWICVRKHNQSTWCRNPVPPPLSLLLLQKQTPHDPLSQFSSASSSSSKITTPANKVSELALSQGSVSCTKMTAVAQKLQTTQIYDKTSTQQPSLRSLSIGQAINHKTLSSRNSATQQNLPQKTGQDARGLLSTDSSGTRSIVAFEL